MFEPGTKVYDVNTKFTGTLKTAPYVSGSGGRQVADVRWDNGEESTVFTSHIRAYLPAGSPGPWPWGPWRTSGGTGHACAPGRCNHEDSADYSPS